MHIAVNSGDGNSLGGRYALTWTVASPCVDELWKLERRRVTLGRAVGHVGRSADVSGAGCRWRSGGTLTFEAHYPLDTAAPTERENSLLLMKALLE